jgi:hypothetical protein
MSLFHLGPFFFFYKFRLSEILFFVSCRLLPNQIMHNYQLLFSDVINSCFSNADVLVLFEINMIYYLKFVDSYFCLIVTEKDYDLTSSV